MDSFIKYGIKLPPGAKGNVKVICPQCTPHQRKPENRNAKDLSVNIEEGVWNCKNCHWKGSLKSKHYVRPEPLAESKINLSDRALEWFKKRGIGKHTLQVFKVHSDVQWFPQVGAEATCIAFPYFRNGQFVNCKYRDGQKNFKMIKDAELVFYNLDGIAKEVVIVEGEIDALSVYETGYYNVLSVPNGATTGNNKLEYLDNCWRDFEDVETIILATDNDEPGIALRNELARRFGRHRCKFITHPEGCKDMNDCLINGHDIKKIIAEATPFPVEGILGVNDFIEEVMDIYDNGVKVGDDTGFFELDSHIKWRKGEYTTITGIPGAGKSRFIDQIANRLASKHGWKIAFCSPEKPPALHTGYLISQFSGSNFFARDERYRMAKEDVNESLWYIQEYFRFYKFSEVDKSVQGIIDKAKELVKSFGLNMLVIDPWNTLDHQYSNGMSETQYISKALDIITTFAKNYDVAVVLVAHPTKVKKENGKFDIPTMYSIQGSSHFFNKTDNGLCVYRDYDTGEVRVYIQKIRNDFVGKLGDVQFHYDKFTGRYSETGDFISDHIYLEKRLTQQI